MKTIDAGVLVCVGAMAMADEKFPEGPGLGIALNDAAIAKYPAVDKVLDTPIGYDGSVQD